MSYGAEGVKKRLKKRKAMGYFKMERFQNSSTTFLLWKLRVLLAKSNIRLQAHFML